MRNHSATHLMHKALRDVLGEHVQQKGSLVDADKTRFDFAHSAPLTRDDIVRIEAIVNHEVLANAATKAQVMPIDAAQKSGAMMLFGEKYGAEVRVLDIGPSRELCGGTHVARTGDIGFFKIVAEGGVAAGIRRIEAVTGEGALAYVQRREQVLGELAGLLKGSAHTVVEKAQHLVQAQKTLEKELQQLKAQLASAAGSALSDKAQEVNGIKVLAHALHGADAKALRDTADDLRNKLGSSVVVLAAAEGDKVSLVVAVSKDLVGKIKAGELANSLAAHVGGKGGGRPDLAMAGGSDPAGIEKALAAVVPALKGWI
jgi:alanyl-tRNA synthetase